MKNNVNIWQYYSQDNARDHIQLRPFVCGKIEISAKSDNSVHNELTFKLEDFHSLLPDVIKRVNGIKEGTFDYYSGHKTKSISDISGYGWFQILVIEEDVICLQLFSKDTMYEISVVLDVVDIDSFINISNKIKEAIPV